MPAPENLISLRDLAALVSEMRVYLRTRPNVKNVDTALAVAGWLHYSYCIDLQKAGHGDALDLFRRDTARIAEVSRNVGVDLTDKP